MRKFFKWKFSKRDDKIFEEISENRFYCQYCKHTIVAKASTEKCICSHCHNLVVNTSKAHFKYKMFKEIRKEN